MEYGEVWSCIFDITHLAAKIGSRDYSKQSQCEKSQAKPDAICGHNNRGTSGMYERAIKRLEDIEKNKIYQ